MFWLLVTVILIIIYFYSTRNHNYWKQRNVKHDPPVPIFGTHFRNFFGLTSITDLSEELYNKYSKEKVIGYYRGNTPELIIRDPEIIRLILNVDAASFYKRGLGRDPEVQPLMLNLFHVEGDRWRLLRQRLTPAFTTNKLRAMFPLIINCAEKFQNVAEDLTKLEEYDVRELMARFTTEFIGSCGFGIEMNSINDDQSQFRALGKRIFCPTLKVFTLMKLDELFPEFMKSVFIGKPDVSVAMKDIFENIVTMRNGKPIGRHDFMDLLLELDAKGKLEGESIERTNADGTPAHAEMQMTDDVIMAQLFIFFAAGFETSSSATSFLLHKLAHHPEIQVRIQEEIDEVLSRYDNKLCYDAVAEMSMLDMAFKEAMRIFPSLGTLNRVCTRKYTLRDLDLTIDPGVKILVPIQAIQHDEKYFDNPMDFRPDRFLPEAVQNRHNYVYLPFGEGPRVCIGMRLGQMQSLAGVAALLQKFSFEPSKSTRAKLEVNPLVNVVQSVKHGVPLRIRRRDNICT